MRVRVPAAPLALLALLGLLCVSCAQQQAPAGNASVRAFKRVKSCAPVNVLVSPSNATDGSTDGASSQSSIEVTAEDAVVEALGIQVGGGARHHALCHAASTASGPLLAIQRQASQQGDLPECGHQQTSGAPSAVKKPASGSLGQQSDAPCPGPHRSS